MAIEHERILSIIEFAQQSAALKANPASDVAQHKIFHEHEHTLQGLPGLQFNVGGEEDEIWLLVERLHESPPPQPKNKALGLWLDLSNTPAKEPELKPAVELSKLIDAGLAEQDDDRTPEDLKKLVFLADFPDAEDLKKNLKTYLENQWQPWADQEKKRRRTIQLYGKLFTLKQQLEGAITDSQLEIVWGVGIGIWNMGETKVSYPLMTRLVDITVNEISMAIEIRPRDVAARLELDIYTAVANAGAPDLEKAYKSFLDQATQTFSPFDRGSFESVLRLAAAALDSKGIYWPAQTQAEDRKLPSASDELKITDTWVIFARPRSKNLFIQDLERFKERIKEDVTSLLPKAVRALVSEPENINSPINLPSFRGMSMVYGSGDSGASTSSSVEDLYFPMPFNDEQVRIVQLLDQHDGVVVQGPPGTGKTHTIANIICHYFALGKRVLVTSMKDPALAVLRDKLPEEVRPLAISLLASEQEGMKQFEHAITRISSEIQRIDRHALSKQTNVVKININQLHSKLAFIDRNIEQWAKKNFDPILLDGNEIIPVDAAHEVVAGAGQYEWLEDGITPASQYNTQFNNGDIIRLRDARKAVGLDLDYLNASLPELDSFPPSKEILKTHQDLSRHNQISSAIDAGSLMALPDSTDETMDKASDLLDQIKQLEAYIKQIQMSGLPWTDGARAQLKNPSSSALQVRDVFDTLCHELENAVSERSHYLTKPVHVPQDAELNEHIVQAVKNRMEGKSAFGLTGLIGKSESKAKFEEIRVVARRPETEDEWRHVHSYLQLQSRFREIIVRWNALAPELGIEKFDSIHPDYALKAKEHLDMYRLIQKRVDLEIRTIQLSRAIFPTWKYHDELADKSERLQEMGEILENHLLRYRLATAWSEKENLQKILAPTNGRIIEKAKLFISKVLGNPSASDHDVQNAWSQLMTELRRIQDLRSYLADILDITERIQKSGAPLWAEKLKTSPAKETQDDLLPDNWQIAWRLCRLANHLNAADGRSELKKLARQRHEAEADLAKAYRDVVTQQTWLKLVENATPSVRSALEAFRGAIAKIGKGTGKRAVRYRQDARNAASRANHVIPCWIMPHWRVSESLPPEFGCFDLVIIDEASQSDLSALPALLRAKKVLIVGDDKQVAPDGVGLEEEKIRGLMARYLANQIDTYRAQMTPERSIYDLFKVVFASSSTMLKEHFRCVGPIIEYSKREFYNHELKPVRLPKTSERLDPPLIDVLVEDGYRDGDINRPEARFIVDEIKRICADPSMEKRTIGVVSLIADKQALRIWEMIEAELGPDEIKKHHITCGDARTFQGKERHIMFLSMVASPADVKAQGGLSTEQRYNVAASRAQDRMYLVRSVELDQLSPNDTLRRNLISHFTAPYAQDEGRVQNLRMHCESDFEREVYDVLTERGYRVIPQVKVGEYRIDMVVEGNNDTRLAVECDGDRYHGADKWDDDMRRQRVLERVGWQFWRSFASTFVKNRNDVIEDLIATLREKGIDPIGSDSAPRSLHTETRRVVAFPIQETVSEPDQSTDSDLLVVNG